MILAPPSDDASNRQPFRVLTYSHDSFGLGHLRRSVTLATAMIARGPQVQALCLTGSPVPEIFRLPERCDLVKLPSIGKTPTGAYRARRLPLPLPVTELTALRSNLITATVRAFRPDLLLIDHTATGPGGELLPVLRRLRHEGLQTRVVLGMRDVLDAPARARAELQREGAFDVLRTLYDHVLVYGDRSVFDPVHEYGFPDDIAAKTSFTGPVVPFEARLPRTPRPAGAPARVLVTPGGGEDGYDLLRGTIAAIQGPLRTERMHATIVAGPMLPAPAFADLERACADDPRIVIVRSTGDMQTLIAGSDLVIGMGGYNTVYETLACGVTMLALPRRHPREEQWERCRRLAARGQLSVLGDTETSDPHTLADAIRSALSALSAPVPGPRTALRCDGADVAARICLAQKRGRPVAPPIARFGS